MAIDSGWQNNVSMSGEYRMLRPLVSLIDRHLHERHAPGTETHLKARALVATLCLGIVFGFLYTLAYQAMDFSIAAATNGTTLLGLLVALVVFLRTGSFVLTTQLMTAVAFLMVGSLVAVSGGVCSHALAWLAIVPLIPLFHDRSWSAIPWAVLVLAYVLALWILAAVGVSIPNSLPERFTGTFSGLLHVGLFMFLTIGIAIINWERQRNLRRLERANSELRRALAEVRELSGLLPICSWCKRIRDDQGYWKQLETYLHEHSRADFSHGICPECLAKRFPEGGDEEPRSGAA